MTTMTLPIRVDHVHTILDQQAQTHTLELRNGTLLLASHSATMATDGANVHLVTEAEATCATAQAFWYAFAGAAEPTAAETELLLADSLVPMQARPGRCRLARG